LSHLEQVINLSEPLLLPSKKKTLLFFTVFLLDEKPQEHSRNQITGASLVAQWLRICLAMQKTPVRSLVQ